MAIDPKKIHDREQGEEAVRDVVRHTSQMLRAYIAEGWDMATALELTMKTLYTLSAANKKEKEDS